MKYRHLPLLAALLGMLAAGCSDERPGGLDPDAGAGGSGAGGSGAGGSEAGGEAGAGGSSEAGGSGAVGGDAGAPGTGGMGAQGSGGETNTGGSGGDVGGSGGGTGGGNIGGSGGSAGAVGGTGPVFDPCPSDDAGGGPPAFGGLCDISPTWGEPEAVLDDNGITHRLVSITPDELSMLWLVISASGGRVVLADRLVATDPFGDPVAVDAIAPMALSPDGLRLIALGPTGTLGEHIRPSRAEAFGSFTEGAFSALNAYAMEDGVALTSFVHAANDQALYYVATGAGLDYPVHVSRRTGDEPWPVGAPLETCELKASGLSNRSPTGISADELTLFFFDPGRGTSRAAFRETVDSPFTWFVDLERRLTPQPNATCDWLYYSLEDASVSLVASPAE